jgi:hypothetical protein
LNFFQRSGPKFCIHNLWANFKEIPSFWQMPFGQKPTGKTAFGQKSFGQESFGQKTFWLI